MKISRTKNQSVTQNLRVYNALQLLDSRFSQIYLRQTPELRDFLRLLSRPAGAGRSPVAEDLDTRYEARSGGKTADEAIAVLPDHDRMIVLANVIQAACYGDNLQKAEPQTRELLQLAAQYPGDPASGHAVFMAHPYLAGCKNEPY